LLKGIRQLCLRAFVQVKAVFGLTAGRASDTHGSWDESLTADAFSGRDHGYGALAGIAVTAAGRPDDATDMGHESLGIAAATGSVRTLTELSTSCGGWARGRRCRLCGSFVLGW
jgi:hypothetical protein